MRRRLFIFVVIVGVMLCAADRLTAGACGPEGRPLRLRLVNDARAAAETLDHAKREAEQIWATGGVRLVWERTDDVDAYVIVRDTLARSAARAASAAGTRRSGSRSRQVMGRVLIDEAGRPTRLIHVSLEATTVSVMKSQERTWQGRPLPRPFLQQFLGRALGRVIAHEIGHWLHGRDHASEGLMKPVLYPRDLVAYDPPPLPPAWRQPQAVASEALRCVR